MADNNNDNGSIFKTALIAAPVVAGGIFSARRLAAAGVTFSQLTKPFTEVQNLPSQLAAQSIRNFASQYAGATAASPVRQWQIDQLVTMAATTRLTASQARDAVLAAATAVDAAGGLRRRFQEQLANAATGSEVLQSFAKSLETTESIYARRAASVLMEDLGILEERVEAGLTIEPSGKVLVQPERFQALISLDELNPRIAADIRGMQDLIGAEIKVTKFSRMDIPGGEMTLSFPETKRTPSFELRVPMEIPGRPGIVSRGAYQQSQYIAGRFGIVEQGALVESPLKYEEWLVHRMRQELPEFMDNKSRWEFKKAVQELTDETARSLEWIPSIKPGVHQGLDEYVAARTAKLSLSNLKGQQLDVLDVARILEAGGLKTPAGDLMSVFPGFSAEQAATGVVATKDVRDYTFLVPEAAPWEYKPGQFLRKEFAPTSHAIENMERDVINQYFGWAGAHKGVPAPMLRTAFVSSAYDDILARHGVTSEGQNLISRGMWPQMEQRQWQQFDVATDQMLDLAEMLGKEKGGRWELNRVVEAGTVLGRDPSGRPVVVPEQMRLIDAVGFLDDASKGSFVRVMAEKEMGAFEQAKFYGLKGMGAFGEPEAVERTLGEVGVSMKHGSMLPASRIREDIVRGIDAIASMDYLKKNRALHYNQMFTSLWDFTNQNMTKGLQVSQFAQRFAEDPIHTISVFRARATKNNILDHNKMVAMIGRLSRGAGLDPEQMGRVFGAVPDVMGDLGALAKIGLAPIERREIEKKVAFGAAQLFYGGPGGSGAGGRATIEPRAYELLEAPHWGELGPQIQADIRERMLAAYPERIFEQQELTKALETVMYPQEATNIPVVAPSDLITRREVNLPLEPTTMRIKGIGDIYIPGRERIRQLAGYQTAADQGVESSLAYAYKDVIDLANQLQSKQVEPEAVKKKLATLGEELTRARVATITGTGGLLRNEIPGTASLTAMVPTAEDRIAPGAVGITEKYANRMFDEMLTLTNAQGAALYNTSEIEAMRKSFLAGETVPGLVGRHPYISPYSTQATMIQRISGEGDRIVVPEIRVRAAIWRGSPSAEQKHAAVEALARGGWDRGSRYSKELGLEIMSSPLRLSPLVGLSGDVDGDTLSVMFSGPQLNKSLTSHIMSADTQAAYQEYAIRSQVMKAKVRAGDVTLQRLMAGAQIKQSVTGGPRSVVGRLSVGMQQYRAAVLAGAGELTAQERMDAMGLLEWMEQTPIAAKHVKAGSEENLLYLLNDIEQAMANKDATKLVRSAEAVLAEAKEGARGGLREGFTIALEDVGRTGRVRVEDIRGINVERTASNLANVMRVYEGTAAGQIHMAKMREVLMGRGGRLDNRTIISLMDPKVTAQNALSALLLGGKQPGTMSQLVARATSFTNKLAATGRSMLPYAKPLALGTGIALGLAAVLSSPPSTLGPGAAVAPQPDMGNRGHTEQLDTNIHPDNHISGRPSLPSRMNAPTARLAPPASTGYRVSVRGSTGNSIDYNSLSGQLRQAAGVGSRSNASVRDQRTSLTPQKIARILKGER